MISRRLPAVVVLACAGAYAACDGDIQLGGPAPSLNGADASVAESGTGDATADASNVSPDRPYGTCTAEADCKISTLHCELARGACVECRGDGDCISSERRFCDQGSSRCLGCRGDGDCDASKRCETATHRCVERCSDFRPCALGFCEEATGRCIECSPGSSCADQKVCSTSAVCVECRSDADCAASGDEPRCDPLLGRCVYCTSNADCLDGKVCDPSRGECSSSGSN